MPFSLLRFLRNKIDAITLDSEFLKKVAMAQLNARPPHMGSTTSLRSDALATSSSSYYTSSGSSMFDRISPTATSLSEVTPPMTPIPSDEDDNEKNAKLDTTTELESTPMPLIEYAPDLSVDISAITPETMQLVMLLVELGCTQDAGTILNNIVGKKKKMEAVLEGKDIDPSAVPDEEEEEKMGNAETTFFDAVGPTEGDWLDYGCFEPPFGGNSFAQDAAQIPEQAQQPFINGVLESMQKPLGPPPAPRLAPIQLYDDDDITPLSLSEDTIAVKSSTLAELVRPLDYDGFNEHPYQPIPSVATPSSILFGTQPEPVSFSARVPSSFVQGALPLHKSYEQRPSTVPVANGSGNNAVFDFDDEKPFMSGSQQPYLQDAPAAAQPLIDMTTQLPSTGVQPDSVLNLNQFLYGTAYVPNKGPSFEQPSPLPTITFTAPDVLPPASGIPISYSQSSLTIMAGQSHIQQNSSTVSMIQTSVSQQLPITPPAHVQSSSLPHLASLVSNLSQRTVSPNATFDALVSEIEALLEGTLSRGGDDEVEDGNGDVTAQLSALIREARSLQAPGPADASFASPSSDSNSPSPSKARNELEQQQLEERVLSLLKVYSLLSVSSTPRRTREQLFFEMRHKLIERRKGDVAKLLFPGAHASNHPIPRVYKDRNDPFHEPPSIASIWKSRIPVAMKTPTRTQSNEGRSPPLETKSSPKGPSMIPRWSRSRTPSPSSLRSSDSTSLRSESPAPSPSPPVSPAPAPSPSPAPSAPLPPAPSAPLPPAPAPAPTARRPSNLPRIRPLVPRKSSASSSSSVSSNSSKASSVTSDAASTRSSSASSNEEALAPAGMAPEAWEQILAIVPRRSNNPNPNAPNVFNMSPQDLARAAGSRIPMRSRSASPSSLPPSPSPTAAVEEVEEATIPSPTSSQFSDWSSQWLSPDAYDERKAAEAEAQAALDSDVVDSSFEGADDEDDEVSRSDSPQPRQHSPDLSWQWQSPDVQYHPRIPTQTWDMAENVPRSSNTPGWYGNGLDSDDGEDDDDGPPPFGPSSGSLISSNSSSNLAGVGKGLPSMFSRESSSSLSSILTLSGSTSFKTLPSVNHLQRSRVLYAIEEEPALPDSTTSSLLDQVKLYSTTNNTTPAASFIISELDSPFVLVEAEDTMIFASDGSDNTPQDESQPRRSRVAITVQSSIKSLFSRFKLPLPSIRGKTRRFAQHIRAPSASSTSTSPTLVVHGDLEQDLKVDGQRLAAAIADAGAGVRRGSRSVLQGLKRLF